MLKPCVNKDCHRETDYTLECSACLLAHLGNLNHLVLEGRGNHINPDNIKANVAAYVRELELRPSATEQLSDNWAYADGHAKGYGQGAMNANPKLRARVTELKAELRKEAEFSIASGDVDRGNELLKLLEKK
jgi:hypothetical protein